MSSKKASMMRRDFLRTAGAGTIVLCGMGSMRFAVAQETIKTITAMRNYGAGRYYFNPLGLYVTRGETVQWVAGREGFSATAYHPDNDNHELRIPENARSFDSGVMNVDTTFEYTFEVEGTYDFYSIRQEVIGAVGRIVVGSPGGPGEKPLGYGLPEGRRPIFKEVEKTFAFAKSADIVSQGRIPYPVRDLNRYFPLY